MLMALILMQMCALECEIGASGEEGDQTRKFYQTSELILF